MVADVECVCRNLAGCVPSLADLSRMVLGRVLRAEAAPHDCADDARAAMALVAHLLREGMPCMTLDPPHSKARAWPLPASSAGLKPLIGARVRSNVRQKRQGLEDDKRWGRF